FMKSYFLEGRLSGIFLPFLRASERPMAMACLRLLTFPPLPPFPLFNFPFLNLCISRPTSWDALREYLRGMGFSCCFHSAIFQRSHKMPMGKLGGLYIKRSIHMETLWGSVSSKPK